MMDMMELEEVNTSSRWVKLLYYLWKIFTCLFLHLLLIAIVIGYCFFGMFMFQNLESQYEKDVSWWNFLTFCVTCRAFNISVVLYLWSEFLIGVLCFFTVESLFLIFIRTLILCSCMALCLLLWNEILRKSLIFGFNYFIQFTEFLFY